MPSFWSTVDTAGLATLDQATRPGVASVATLQRLVQVGAAQQPTLQQSALLALVLLWHDHHDASHQLVQEHEDDPDHNYVHMLFHRREGDFANAKYWARRIGAHRVPWLLALQVDATLWPPVVRDGCWQANVMIDSCAAARRDRQRVARLMELQQLEFATLAAWLMGETVSAS